MTRVKRAAGTNVGKWPPDRKADDGMPQTEGGPGNTNRGTFKHMAQPTALPQHDCRGNSHLCMTSPWQTTTMTQDWPRHSYAAGAARVALMLTGGISLCRTVTQQNPGPWGQCFHSQRPRSLPKPLPTARPLLSHSCCCHGSLQGTWQGLMDTLNALSHHSDLLWFPMGHVSWPQAGKKPGASDSGFYAHCQDIISRTALYFIGYLRACIGQCFVLVPWAIQMILSLLLLPPAPTALRASSKSLRMSQHPSAWPRCQCQGKLCLAARNPARP